MRTSAACEGRAEDAGNLLEEVENSVTAGSGEVEEQERLLSVRVEEDIGQVLGLEDARDPVDVDIHLAVRVNLGNMLINISLLNINSLYLTLANLLLLRIGEPVGRNINFPDCQLQLHWLH